jgi:hypothetical protein
MDYRLSSDIGKFLFAILLATIISIFCTIWATDKNTVESLIAEYSVMEGVIVLLTVLTILNMKARNIGLFTFDTFITLFPFLLIIFIVGYYIALLSIYIDRIATNKVSPYYSSFSGTFISLIIAQIMVLINDIMKKPDSSPILSRKTFSILMFLGTINTITVITLGIILKLYSTDC